DFADQESSEVGINALAQNDRLTQPVARGLLRRFVFERGVIDLAPSQVHFQQLVHLLQFELVVSKQGEHPFLPVDRAFAALEVEARADLARHPSERVVDLGEVDSRDYVEAWHGAAPLREKS